MSGLLLEKLLGQLWCGKQKMLLIFYAVNSRSRNYEGEELHDENWKLMLFPALCKNKMRRGRWYKKKGFFAATFNVDANCGLYFWIMRIDAVAGMMWAEGRGSADGQSRRLRFQDNYCGKRMDEGARKPKKWWQIWLSATIFLGLSLMGLNYAMTHYLVNAYSVLVMKLLMSP